MLGRLMATHGVDYFRDHALHFVRARHSADGVAAWPVAKHRAENC